MYVPTRKALEGSCVGGLKVGVENHTACHVPHAAHRGLPRHAASMELVRLGWTVGSDRGGGSSPRSRGGGKRPEEAWRQLETLLQVRPDRVGERRLAVRCLWSRNQHSHGPTKQQVVPLGRWIEFGLRRKEIRVFSYKMSGKIGLRAWSEVRGGLRRHV